MPSWFVQLQNQKYNCIQYHKLQKQLFVWQEFSKEVDAKSSLRSSVLNTGNQLLRLKRVDTAGLRSAMGQIDTQWAELLTHIPVVQEKLHQVCGSTTHIKCPYQYPCSVASYPPCWLVLTETFLLSYFSCKWRSWHHDMPSQS